jgi:Fe-S cluster biosynthesis and repair protein YggX
MENREIGGYFDILGNTTMFANGFVAWKFATTSAQKKAGISRMATGLLWNIPNFIMARYGGQPVDKQFERLQHKLAEHLSQQGVPLDVKTLKMADEEKRRTYFQKVEDYLYTHPVEVNNACLGVFSLGMMGSGFLRMRAGEKEAGIGNIAVSALTLASTLAGIMIPEKTDEQLAASGQKGTLWGTIQKFPLYFANVGILAADATEGLNAYGEFKTARSLPKGHAYKKAGYAVSGLSAATMVSYLIGDSLVGFGSKKASGTDEERSEAQKQLVKEASRMIMAQPEKVRKTLAHDMAKYLVQQRELRLTDYSHDPAKLENAILAAMRGDSKPLSQMQGKAAGDHAEPKRAHATTTDKAATAHKSATKDKDNTVPDSYVPEGAKTVKNAMPQVIEHQNLRDAQQ